MSAPAGASVAELEQTFGALADATRLAVVDVLRRGPRRSSELADALAVPRPAMSKHLQALRKAGLVEEVPQSDDARARVYQLRAAKFAQVRSWVEEVEAFWGAQLDAFKEYAERAHGPGAREATKPGRGPR